MVNRQEGNPFAMSQPARQELLIAAREGVFNAILHRHAQLIKAELRYTHEALSLTMK